MKVLFFQDFGEESSCFKTNVKIQVFLELFFKMAEIFRQLNVKDLLLKQTGLAKNNSTENVDLRKYINQNYNSFENFKNFSKYNSKPDNYSSYNYPSLEQGSTSFIRKLGSLEKTFHGQSEKQRCYIYRTILVSSDIDIFKNINILKKAIKEWKNLNPLLRCVVAKKQGDDYFAFPPESSNEENHLKNVKLLTYTTKLAQRYDEIWKLIVEWEKTIGIEDNSFCWRLTFFQIKNANKDLNQKSYYAIIFTYDHSISRF